MTLWHLVLREILHRKLNAVLACAAVVVATACLVGALALLKSDAHETELILAEKQQAVEKAGAELEDAMRKITLGLGFNVVILPEDQDLQAMHSTGAISKTMPEEYVDRLAASDIVTINHILPTVTSPITWPEKELPIILYGTRGEVPQMHRDPKKPLLDAVPRGSMIVGYHIGLKLEMTEGEKVDLMGRPFEVIKIHDERGSVDDSTVWINLREAQEMLGLENLIHAIQALECECAGDRLAVIRKEIAEILPGTQVIERGAPALARAEARNQAKVTAVESLATEVANRQQLRERRETFTALFIPLTTAGCALWMGLTSFTNVRQRREEIAILGAIGLRSKQILSVFLGKAVITGFFGAGIGLLLGLAVGSTFRDTSPSEGGPALLDTFTLILAFGLALGVAIIGSWLPALIAARQDAATVLQQD